MEYFNISPVCENGIVMFFDTKKKAIVETHRFQVYIFIPSATIPYFVSPQEWNELTAGQDIAIPVDYLSNVSHGFRSNSFFTSKSLFYEAPYFLIFKSINLPQSNCLLFDNYYIPGKSEHIVSMLIYDEKKDAFEAKFSPGITFHYKDSLSLSNVIEFCIHDSNGKRVALLDGSRLYIQLSIIK